MNFQESSIKCGVEGCGQVKGTNNNWRAPFILSRTGRSRRIVATPGGLKEVAATAEVVPPDAFTVIT